MKKRILALVLTVAMTLSFLPFSAFAADGENAATTSPYILKVPESSDDYDIVTENGENFIVYNNDNAFMNEDGSSNGPSKNIYCTKITYGEDANGLPSDYVPADVSTSWIAIRLKIDDKNPAFTMFSSQLEVWLKNANYENGGAGFGTGSMSTRFAKWLDLADGSLTNFCSQSASGAKLAGYEFMGDMDGYLLLNVSVPGKIDQEFFTKGLTSIELFFHDRAMKDIDGENGVKESKWINKDVYVGDAYLVTNLEGFAVEKCAKRATSKKYSPNDEDTAFYALRVGGYRSSMSAVSSPTTGKGRHNPAREVGTASSSSRSVLHITTLPNGDRAYQVALNTTLEYTTGLAQISSADTYDESKTSYRNTVCGMSVDTTEFAKVTTMAFRVATTGIKDGNTAKLGIDVRVRASSSSSSSSISTLGEGSYTYIDANTGDVSTITVNSDNRISLTENIDGYILVPVTALGIDAANAKITAVDNKGASKSYDITTLWGGYFNNTTRGEAIGYTLDTGWTTGEKLYVGDVFFVQDAAAFERYHTSCKELDKDIAKNHLNPKEEVGKLAATCDKEGYTGDTVCEDCGKVLDEGEKINALGHDFSVKGEVKEPTCTEGGYTVYSCSRNCGATENKDITPKEEHVQGTATPNGDKTHTYTCKNCPETLTTEDCNLVVDEELSYDAQPGVEGKEVKVCSVCGYKVETTIDALPTCDHSKVEYRNPIAATCTDKGYEGDKYCADCGEPLGKGAETPATGHDYKEEITTPAECEKDGVKTFTCQNAGCNDSYTETIPATKHNMEAGEVVAPTCTEKGYTVYTCANGCGTTENRDEKPATGHNYVGVVTKEPTYNDEGVETFTCNKCGDSYTNPIAKLEGAQAEIDDYKYATLQEALNQFKDGANAGKTVKLLKDINVTQYLDVFGTVTINLNGYTIKGTKDFGYYPTIFGSKNSDLTIMGGGKITDAYNVAVGTYGILTIKDVTIEALSNNPDYAYGVVVYSWDEEDWNEEASGEILLGKATIEEGAVIDNVFNYATLIIDGGEIELVESIGALTVIGGDIAELFVEEGTVAIADPTAVKVPDDFKLVEVEKGVYKVVAKTYVAQVGEEKFETLADAIAAAQDGDTVELLANHEGTVVLLANVKLDLNGKTIKGNIVGTLVMNNGTWITPDKDYVMAGPDADYYITTDAVLTMDANGNIVVEEGKIELAQDWWTLKGQTLTIAEDATFVVPAGMNLNVLSTVIVEGTAVVDGTITLYDAAATITVADDTLNVITIVNNAKVVYENGKYIVHVHVWSDATCTEPKKCECGDTSGDKLGHIEVIDAAKTPTCTETGLTEGKHCSVCDKVLVAQEEVAALGHTEEILPAVAPTLNSTGLTEGKKCSVCGKILKEQQIVDKIVGEASINGYNYETLEEAIAAAKAGDTVLMTKNADASAIITIDKAITLDGNGFKLTSTAGRAINVSGANGVTIKNLTIKASGERAINVIQGATNVTIENVDATAANYTVNLAGSAANAVVTIKNSTLTGLNVVNIAAAGAVITVDDTTLNCADKNNNEDYAALVLNKDATNGKITATNVTFNIAGTSDKAINGAVGGVITIDGSTAEVDIDVAYIAYGDYYYGFTSLAEAVEAAKDGETIVLLRDVVLTETLRIKKKITIDLNGNDIDGNDVVADFYDVYGTIDVWMAGDLTVKGKGKIVNLSGDVFVVFGKLTIEEGVIVESYAEHNDGYALSPIFNVEGTVVINGGKFNGLVYNYGTMYVNGGEIDKIEVREGCKTYIADGSKIIAEYPDNFDIIEIEDGVYTAVAHEYEAAITAPTCTEKGYTTYTCKYCGDTYVANYVDALDHTEVIDAAKTPTCTETGLTEGKHCSVCGEVLVAQKEVAALDHKYDAVVTAPTCINGGYTTYTCSVCGDTYKSDVTEATGVHSLVAAEVVPAEQLKAGYTIYDCEHCDYTEEKDFVMPKCNGVQNLNASFVNGTNDLRVTWDSLDRASKYIVYVYNEEGIKVAGAVVENGTSARFNDMDNGKYTIKVNAKVGSKYTSNIPVVIAEINITAPTPEKVDVTENTITIKWNHSINYLKYFVQVVGGGKTTTFTTTESTLVIGNLVPGTEYSIKINGHYNTYDYTGYGEALVITTKKDANVSVGAGVKDGCIKVTWESEPAGDMYWLHRVDEEGNSVKLLAITSSTEAIVEYIDGQNRFKVISRIKVDGKYKYVTSEVFEYKGAAVETPKVTGSTTQTADGIKVTWESSDEADQYWLHRVDEEGNSIKLLAITSSTEAIVDYIDGQNRFKVISRIKVNGKYKYVESDVFEYDGPKVEAPKVTGKATETSEGIEITWEVNAEADKYWIYRVVDGKNVLLKISTGNTVTVPSDESSEFKVCARIKAADGSYKYITSSAFVATAE